MKATNPTPVLAPRFDSLRQEFDRLVDRFIEPRAVTLPFGDGAWLPDTDLVENEKEFVVRLEVPGISKEQLEVKLEGDLLMVRGERKETTERKDERFVWRERTEGAFARSLRLPSPVDPARVEASVKDGVLTVTLPRLAPPNLAKIPVK